jgi:hypothetical protein
MAETASVFDAHLVGQDLFIVSAESSHATWVSLRISVLSAE